MSPSLSLSSPRFRARAPGIDAAIEYPCLDAGQIAQRPPAQHLAAMAKRCIVAQAVEAPMSGVPADVTAHVRADGRDGEHVTTIVDEKAIDAAGTEAPHGTG